MKSTITFLFVFISISLNAQNGRLFNKSEATPKVFERTRSNAVATKSTANDIYYQIDSITGSDLKELYFYNEAGRNDSMEIYMMDDPVDGYYPYHKEVYTYNISDDFLTIDYLEEDYDNEGAWLFNWKEDFTYTPENRIDTVYSSYYDDMADEMVTDGGEVYYYSAENKVDSVITYELDGENWVTSYKEEFLYDGNGMVSEFIEYSAVDNWEWEIDWKETYHYNTMGKKDSIQVFQYDMDIDDLYIRYVDIFTYDESDRITTLLHKSREDSDAELVNKYLGTLTYEKNLEDTILVLPNEGEENFFTELLVDMPISYTDEIWNSSEEKWEDPWIFNMHYSLKDRTTDTPDTPGTYISEGTVRNSIKIAPNPAHDFIILSVDKGLETSAYTIFDINARTIKEGNLSDNIIYIGNMEPGTYFMSISISTGANHIERFIKK